jgi:2-keto-4-pentenoate hydratase/2-oxohepta-3-ene-1,7-dioic acid hydratase in catechol pathway
MKLLTYRANGREQVGFLSSDGTQVYALDVLGVSAKSMQEVVEQVSGADLAKRVPRVPLGVFQSLPYEAVEHCAPIPHPQQDVICLGINYMDHAEESARFHQEAFGGERPYPVFFSKRVWEAVPDGGKINAHTDLVTDLDYECELAVVIGREADHVSPEQAYDHVFGYTIMNDVSARGLQTRHKQWYFGKSLDGFAPMGPWIVTTDELPGKPALDVRCRVNGELRQTSNTSLLIHDVAQVISTLSQGMVLRPGTIIAMGTPAGVGMGFHPPKWLKSGDVVTCEIEGIGTLTNTVSR